jgi:hypothetical protein
MPNKFIKIYKDRKDLNENINPTLNLDEKFYEDYFIDIWYNKPFYGRIDTKGFSVIPREQKLKFSSVGTDIIQSQALDFVAELFRDLKSEYERNYKNGNINRKSPFFEEKLQARNAFTTSRPIYLQKLKSLYSQYLDYIINNSLINKINEFQVFVDEFKKFITNQQTYFTRAGFVESKDFSILNTGLALEIVNRNYSDSSIKKSFYEDPNYGAFLELCLRHGFVLDKEIPWRIYCDIRQKKVEDTIVRVNKNSNIKFVEGDLKKDVKKLFDVYYERVLPETENDYKYFEEFITAMQSLYQSFILQFPNYKISTIDKCGNAKIIKLKKKQINMFNSPEEYLKYFLKLFFDFRKIEIKDNISEDRFNYIVSICLGNFDKHKDSNKKKAICDSIGIFSRNISTVPYREKSLIQGGPIKGPA